MPAYFDELRLAMERIAQHPRAVFIGQAVAYPGTAMSRTFENISRDKLIEFPVAEDMQMGAAIGMALNGDLPVCIYPRWNFLLLATNQLVLHLDKLPLYSRSGYRPKVIIRTAIATDDPLDPGPQHLGDFTDAFTLMLKTVRILRLYTAQHVRECYEEALEYDGSTVLVEYAAKYT